MNKKQRKKIEETLDEVLSASSEDPRSPSYNARRLIDAWKNLNKALDEATEKEE